jgi:hypothetical protein
VKFQPSAAPDGTIWKLIPEGVAGPDVYGLGPLPPYDENEPRHHNAHFQHAGYQRDDLGTVVTEITTSTVTTRKTYRVEDA